MKIKYKLHASLLAKVRKLYLASLSIILRGPVLSCSTEGVGVPSYYILRGSGVEGCSTEGVGVPDYYTFVYCKIPESINTKETLPKFSIISRVSQI
ncbi:extensin-like [Iris pallida]|uniref:Extensin-like n=1 Tax=Iris pallida TaxID=29817 RepID=A0AAX6IIH4_IRIPA|nr:extensin-like [Iris pallida]